MTKFTLILASLVFAMQPPVYAEPTEFTEEQLQEIREAQKLSEAEQQKLAEENRRANEEFESAVTEAQKPSTR